MFIHTPSRQICSGRSAPTQKHSPAHSNRFGGSAIWNAQQYDKFEEVLFQLEVPDPQFNLPDTKEERTLRICQIVALLLLPSLSEPIPNLDPQGFDLFSQRIASRSQYLI